MTEKINIKEKEAQIITLSTKFCYEHLDSEYSELSVKLIKKLGQLNEVPYVKGTAENWASAVIHCLGTINLLWDDSFLPYVPQSKIFDYFTANKSIVISKSKLIQELLDLKVFDKDFSTRMMAKSNPLKKMKFNTNGEIVEKEHDDEESLQELFEMYFKEPLINRCGITVMPLKPFIDWVKYVTPDFKVPPEQRNLGNTYLADMVNVEEDYNRVLNQVYSRIFENELRAITKDENLWPQIRTIDVFQKWFVYKIDPMVFDLGEEEPLEEIDIDPFSFDFDEEDDFNEDEDFDDEDGEDEDLKF